ncbi:MAG: hypothetical protein JO194_11400 [Candidatus Eremiobacteraeota bacterium]|nr:hypothetical protein [Candidatus Eremiobacteraeota bacterium]
MDSPSDPKERAQLFRLASTILPGILLAAALMHVGYLASSANGAAPVALGLIAYALAFVALVGALFSRPLWSTHILPAICLAAYVMWLLAAHLTSVSVVNPAFEQYQSDSLAFSAYSARLVLAGSDPYTASMAPAAQAFRVSPPVQTPTTDGGRISVQPYPALSFLVYVPFMFAHVQSMIWVNIGFAIGAFLLVLVLAPAALRIYFGLLFLLIPEYRDFAAGSGTDVVWLPFMIGVAATWQRRPVLCATLLGLACAIKQEPWFVVPFALLHWWQMEDRSALGALRYAAIMLAAFALPNLPWMLWHPAAWLTGVLSPMMSHAIPSGSGLIHLQTSGLISLPLAAYTLMWLSALLVCVAAYAQWPRRLAWLPFIAPAFVLFFSPRSLQNYFIYWPIVLAVYAGSALLQREELARQTSAIRLREALGAVAAFALLLLCVGASAAGGQEVRITGAGAQRDARTGYIDRISVSVNNPRAHSLALRFAVADGNNAMVFWRSDAAPLPAHADAQVVLRPPSLSGELPGTATAFQVVAFAPKDGIAVYTPVVETAAAPAHGLRNGSLLSAIDSYQMLPVRSPLGWDADPRAFLDGGLSVVAAGPFDRALRFHGRSHAAATSALRISQTFVPVTRRYTFWLRPEIARGHVRCAPHRFGILFADAFGRVTAYIADTAARSRIERRSTGALRVRMPASAASWNRYDIALARDLTPPVTVSVGEFAPTTCDDDFGGIVER